MDIFLGLMVGMVVKGRRRCDEGEDGDDDDDDGFSKVADDNDDDNDDDRDLGGRLVCSMRLDRFLEMEVNIGLVLVFIYNS